MSSDYRPRGGSGNRRRRGGRGRNRNGQHAGGEPSHTSHGRHPRNGAGTAAAKKNPIAKLFGWLLGKREKPEAPRPSRGTSNHPTEIRHREQQRAERQDREPRTERPPREERAPKVAELTPQEITTTKLYVGNLSYDAAESDLYDLFSKVGQVKNVEIAQDRRSNRSKGFGFVEMEALETAKAAAEKYNRTDFLGRQIVVSGAKLERRSVNQRDGEAAPADAADTAAPSSPESSETV